MKKRLLNTAMVLVALSPALAQSAQSAPVELTPAVLQDTTLALTQRMDAAIAAAIAEDRIVGTVVLVARGGEVVYARAAGLADREAGEPMTEDTIFRLASVTKVIVTTAVMQLVEEDRIGLDDPVTNWLPDFQPTFEGETPVITIRQLLTHTSGLNYTTNENGEGPYTDAGVIDGLAEPTGERITLEENMGRIASAPLLYEPGSSWTYSVATDVLGAVVEAETGMTLEAAVAELVTGPLGMDDTAFVIEKSERVAVPYRDGDPEPVRMAAAGITTLDLFGTAVLYEPARNFDLAAFPSGGSGMSGTAEDVLTLLEVIRTGGDPILEAATTAEMMTDQVGPQAAANGPGWGFGFGGAVLDDPAATETPQDAGTYSWSGAYGNTWFVDPANELTVVALTNTAFEGIYGQFATDVRNAAYGE